MPWGDFFPPGIPHPLRSPPGNPSDRKLGVGKAIYFLDTCEGKIYYKHVSCKEFWFGAKTSRMALEA